MLLQNTACLYVFSLFVMMIGAQIACILPTEPCSSFDECKKKCCSKNYAVRGIDANSNIEFFCV